MKTIRNNNPVATVAAVMMCCIAVLASCSTTSALPEGEQLYVGIDKIAYNNYERGTHFTETQEEVEAALACQPNGALFGSSSVRSPFPVGLWVWNAFAGAEGKIGKWIGRTFGKHPVLMSDVNAPLRATVAQSVLRNRGYFHGKVEYKEITQDNPKKGKVRYDVEPNRLFTIDSVAYVGFPEVGDSLIRLTAGEALVRRGSPFSVAALDAERTRISQLFRNNGYYFYQPSYASYLADTLMVPGKVQLRFRLADNIPERARHKWYLGRIKLTFRRRITDVPTDSVERRRFTLRFSGRRTPVRASAITKGMKMRQGQLFSYDDLAEAENAITASGLFSMVNFTFTPRDSSPACDTLDLDIACLFDKKYDFYAETGIKGRTTGRMGPELVLGLKKRNAFRGGETFDVNMHGLYEWSTKKRLVDYSDMATYKVGLDASLTFPRLVTPFNLFNSQRRALNRRRREQQRRRRQYYAVPSTVVKMGFDIESRSDYFRMHTASGELTYRWQSSPTSSHSFSPLTVVYQFKNSMTHLFDSIVSASPYLMQALDDRFIMKISYTYSYAGARGTRNPIAWETTISEAGNLVSLGFMATGKKWSTTGKEMFNNPYAQFVKINTDFVKRWRVGEKSSLVAHLNAGVIWSFGNNEYPPFSEQFFVGGANSIRAFTVRSIGPGRMQPDKGDLAYLLQTGDLKLLANLEYRFNLFGNLNGAVFLDAGNVWNINGYNDDDERFKIAKFPRDIAVGTGLGLRYDLEFLVLRVDWGFALHAPYNTGNRGYFNMRKFGDMQSINFAVGYPF
ncbi:MAG: BamA/TamA family outer membrane protein [Prevotella sp.]|uniref:translocation and assembly module lipoprotein TamL n=1 Tax=Prevotella sp. TaxID=59823 RepID=UPI002A25141F|nr:BamA/TamA family outer membrane protein [Prevotella sp.]MDD7319316.1 BamA/TamA family outer membrane protein [Prevotellaceae bacterium]MDY4020854.1 BamA/TamA family outer membrane protein [Prevotella sp.]